MVGLVMGIVMMGTIMLIATMMVEIAVDLMSIQTGACECLEVDNTVYPSSYDARSQSK